LGNRRDSYIFNRFFKSFRAFIKQIFHLNQFK
jgi:hypothetical protein